jgi:hypothetical protein
LHLPSRLPYLKSKKNDLSESDRRLTFEISF